MKGKEKVRDVTWFQIWKAIISPGIRTAHFELRQDFADSFIIKSW